MSDAAYVEGGSRARSGRLYRAWFLALLIAAYASSFVDRIILAVVGQAVKVDMNLSDTQLGLLGGLAFSIFYATLGIPMARLAERYSRVTLTAISIGAWSVLTALCGTASGFWQLLVYRLGVGVGEAGSTPTAHSLIADLFPEARRATALSLYNLGPPLGVILGAFGGGWVAQNMGWRSAFYVVGLPGAALCLLVWLTIREPVRMGPTTREPIPPLASVIRLLLSSKTFVHMLLGTIVGAFALYGINLFLPVYMARVYGMNLAQSGIMFGLITGVGGIIGSAVGGYLADAGHARDKRWYAWIPALGALVGCPLAAAAFWMHDWYVAGPLLLLYTILLNLWVGPTFAIVQGLVTSRMRATASALVFMLMNLIGQGFGPMSVGLLSDKLAAYLYVGGDFAVACQPGKAAAAACAQASATGLRYAMFVMTLTLLWSAFHYYRASRHIQR